MSAGYWWPNKDFIIVSNRPQSISRDERGRLHNESDNSIKYRDGWGLYHLHGVAVPRKYIESSPDSIDPKALLKEPNAQVRMAVIGKVGFSRMIRHLKTKEISKGPRSDKLISIDLGEQTIRALHLTWDERDGVHETVLPVPSRRDQFGADCPDNIDDFEQVRRWTLGWNMDVNIVAES